MLDLPWPGGPVIRLSADDFKVTYRLATKSRLKERCSAVNSAVNWSTKMASVVTSARSLVGSGGLTFVHWSGSGTAGLPSIGGWLLAIPVMRVLGASTARR